MQSLSWLDLSSLSLSLSLFFSRGPDLGLARPLQFARTLLELSTERRSLGDISMCG